jgi:DNA (cytosine-5)-methyltransferase 1
MLRTSRFIGLHHLEVPTAKKLSFDGFLCIGSTRRYVQGLTIRDSSVEGYGDSDSPLIVTYVQSDVAHKDAEFDIWIRLNRPSKDYKRFHDPFLWVAQLAKHVIDFMDGQPTGSAGLDSFRKTFHTWLAARFPDNVDFEAWHRAYRGRVDFRTSVNAYIEFLYRQAHNLPNAKQLLAQPLWSDCMVRGLTAIKPQNQVVQHTLATPYVLDCFKGMYFGSTIRAMCPSPPVKTEQMQRQHQLRFPNPPAVETQGGVSWTEPPSRPYNGAPVQVCDVVAFDPTDEEIKFWGSANWQWFGYVQRTVQQDDGVQRLFVLYLYHPRETNIFKASYPYENELFFSDNCNCTEGELLSTEINGRYEVAWMPSNIPTDRYFIRQTYVTQDSAFVSLNRAHMECMCTTQKRSSVEGYQSGDTVYISKTVEGRKILEPVVIRQIDKATGKAHVRKLLRLRRDCFHLVPSSHRTQEIAANELVLTDDYELVVLSRVERRCHIRYVPKHDLLTGKIPFPYNRDGAGDLWTLSMGLTVSNEGQRLMYLARLPDRFREGKDFSLPVAGKTLKGLSIFSGGGGLDQGLHDGGAVDFETTVDFSAEAIHTQRANAPASSNLRYFCGSVDDYLKAALNGKQHESIARVGAVNLVAAGSPCPGM